MKKARGACRNTLAVGFNAELLENRLLCSYSPVGPDVSVATSSTGTPVVASNSAGDFVVAWSASNGATGLDIFAQRYSADGSAIGSAFVVNTTTSGDQINPAVAMDGSGDFVIGWSIQTGASVASLFAQSYTALGAADSGEILLTSAAAQTSGPQLAMAPDANFEAAWVTQSGTTLTVVAQRYLASGAPNGAAIQIQQSTGQTSIASMQVDPMASDSNGDFALAWVSGYYSVNVAEYSEGGSALISPTNIATNAYAYTQPLGIGVGIDAPGDMTVAWIKTISSSEYDCYGEQLHALGAVKGTAFFVKSFVSDVAVAMDGVGNFQVACVGSATTFTGQDVITEAFSAAGSAIQTFTTFGIGNSSRTVDEISDDAAGDFVLVSSGGSGLDGAVHAQVFDAFTASGTISGNVWDDLNGNGIYDSTETRVISNCVTNLYNSYGVFITSSAAVSYSFPLVMPGQQVYLQSIPPFYNTATPPYGFYITTESAGPNPATNSVVDPATGLSAILTVQAGQVLGHQNIGLIPTAEITGVVFDDLLENGIDDTSDPALSGQTVFIDANGNGILDAGEMVSSSNDTNGSYGNYTFSLLHPGSYTVVVQSQVGLVDEAVQTVTVTPGQTLVLNLGMRAEYAGALPTVAGSGVSLATSAAQPWVASNDAGLSVVAYTGTSSSSNVFFQRFDATGAATGAATQVNVGTVSNAVPQVAMAADGSFIVVWSNGTSGVMARCYSAQGVAAGSAFVVDGGYTGYQPAIAMNASGDFVVGWAHSITGGVQVYSASFAPGGMAVSGPILISTILTSISVYSASPSVAMRADGTSLIVWCGISSNPSYADVDGQWLSPTGTLTGNAFLIDQNSLGSDSYPTVGMNAAGQTAVVWTGPAFSSNDPTYMLRYNADGSARGNTTMVLQSSGAFAFPRVTVDGSGDVIAAISGSASDACYVDQSGGVTRFSLGSTTSNSGNAYCSVSANGQNDLVAAYSLGTTYVVQRFSALPAIVDSVAASVGGATQMSLRFSQDVTGFPAASQISFENLGTSVVIPASALATTVNSDGLLTVTFPGLPGGVLTSGSYLIDIPAADISTSTGRMAVKDYTYRMLWVAGGSVDDAVILRKSSDGLSIQIFDQIAEGATPSYSVLVSGLNQFSIVGVSGNDSLTLDYTNGIPLPAYTLSYDGGGGVNTLQAINSIRNSIVLSPTQLLFDSSTINFTDTQNIIVNPGTVSDSVTVGGGAVLNIAAAGNGSGIVLKKLMNLTVDSASTLRVLNTYNSDGTVDHSDRDILWVTSLLSMAGTLDLGDNDLLVNPQAASLVAVQKLVQSGLGGGLGITSSTASSDLTDLTTLAVSTSPTSTFDGQSATNSTVVKSTYFGDATFDGKVDGSDYSRIDSGYLSGATGWSNGDFNYDGVINGSDYTLIDNAFNNQGESLASLVASSSTLSTGDVTLRSAVPQINQLVTADDQWFGNKKKSRTFLADLI